MPDRRARAVELLMDATGYQAEYLVTPELADAADEQRARFEELVDLLLPEEPKPIDPMAAGARLVAAARVAYHTERESAIRSYCPGRGRDLTRRQQDACWEAESPDYFDVYRELAEALEPFGGVGPEPEEDDG